MKMESFLKEFEELTHRYVKISKRCRKLLKKADEADVAEVVEVLTKLYILTKKLAKVMQELKDMVRSAVVDKDSSERLNLLSFFVLEVLVPEEREIWERVKVLEIDDEGFQKIKGEIVHIEDLVRRIEDGARYLLSATSISTS